MTKENLCKTTEHLGLVLRYTTHFVRYDKTEALYNTQILLGVYDKDSNWEDIKKDVVLTLIDDDSDFRFYTQTMKDIINYELTLEPIFITVSKYGVEYMDHERSYDWNIGKKYKEGFFRNIEFINNTLDTEIFLSPSTPLGDDRRSILSYESKVNTNELHKVSPISSNSFNSVVTITDWHDSEGNWGKVNNPYDLKPNFEKFDIDKFEKIRSKSTEFFEPIYKMKDGLVRNLIK